MFAKLPQDVVGICEVAKQQTIHHNLLAYYGIPRSDWKGMKRIWPPRMPDILEALKNIEPYNLYDPRQPECRVIGACILESILLGGMLRHKGIPVRVRAGYFKNIRANAKFIVRFWEKLSREKGEKKELLQEDPEKWRKEINAWTIRQNKIDHHIEHWICEYWDKEQKTWRLLDANNVFLKAHSDIDVGFHLPRRHFEFAFEAWKTMREEGENFNPDKYAEEPQDGRSHVRSQLLSDFYSQLNHDVAGYGESSEDLFKFVKFRSYAQVTLEELQELDKLASLLSQEPKLEDLLEFYRNSETLRNETVEKDPYSFVFDN